MKKIISLILAALTFFGASIHLRAQSTFEEFPADRYTDLGGGQVRWETGTLFKTAGFIPLTSSNFVASFLGISPTTLTTINGKTVTQLSLFISLTSAIAPLAANFERSTETFSIQGGTHVILTIKAGSTGTAGGSSGSGGGSTSTGGSTTTAASLKPINVSTLTFCPAGGSVTAGFVLEGTGSQQVLIRAVGPTLAALGVGGVLANPKLTVNKGAAVIGTNDDWSSDATRTPILTGAFTASGAFALPTGSKDAAVLLTLEAGAYTAQAASVDATASGQVILEVYILK